MNNLAELVAAYIYDTFSVSRDESIKYAKDLLATIKSKGGDINSTSAAYLYPLINKQLDRHLQWRDPEKQKQMKTDRELSIASYNSHINKAKR